MFRGMSTRLAVILTLVTLFATMALCICYTSIFVSPALPLNPFPPRGAVDQGVAGVDLEPSANQPSLVVIEVNGSPTFPPTWTPTATPTSTSTPTPTFTSTPTYTPIPTNTPTPTDTATFTPRPPTPPPPPPPPTPTFTPQPTLPTSLWIGKLLGTEVNCGSTGLYGKVRGPGGSPIAGVWVHYWASGWEGAWAESEADFWGDPGDRNWDGLLGDGARAGTWQVAIVAAEGSNELLSNTVTVDTSSICEGQGAAQWAQIEFVRNYY